jgi:DNA-binding GntR family transcriptional regulator
MGSTSIAKRTDMSGVIGLVRAETLRSQVENMLRDAITTGTFAPGARLVERDLCERMGVSRTSVREALRKLEAEKLVQILPHKGPIVATMTKEKASEVYLVRGLLEGFAAREFARVASDAALKQFDDAVMALRVSMLAQDRNSVLVAKTRLYSTLLDNCGNVLIKQMLNSLYTRINLLRVTTLMQPDRLSASLCEIEALQKCINARDEDGAELAARTHVENARVAAMLFLDAEESF